MKLLVSGEIMKWKVTFRTGRIESPQELVFFAHDFWEAIKRVAMALDIMGYQSVTATILKLEKV